MKEKHLNINSNKMKIRSAGIQDFYKQIVDKRNIFTTM